jgi:hypothetical protein
MAFRDLDEFLVAEPVVLPIRGKEYAFPGEVSARTWLRLQRLGEHMNRAQTDPDYTPDAEVFSDLEQDELLREMCGETLDEMLEDEVPASVVKLVFMALLTFHIYDRDAAEAIWNGRGEAVAPNREARRHPAPATKSTPSRGSRATSNSRNKTGQAGRTSSATGSR